MPADAPAAARKTVDKDALRRRYIAERDKRLRADGNAQYVRATGQFSHYLEDPYTPFVEREPKTDHVTFAFIGGGFAGLVTGARLKEQGVTDVRIIDKAGGFGGTWYWNRYPGAQCDTASMIYMPLLEETGHVPTEKYAHAPEILEQCERIARKYSLHDKALFHTEVTGLEWREKTRVWVIRTNRGDEFTAQFVGIGSGPLHVAKLPGVPGIETFKGHAFHTSRWDYAYTGGDPSGARMDKLGDKRVGIIGTGATAVQCVPHLSRDAKELFVFQRTPSSVDVRANVPIDPAWFEGVATPGWQERWLENFTENQSGGIEGIGSGAVDLVQDGWTDVTRRVREKVQQIAPDQLGPEAIAAAAEDADFEKMEEIRARVDAIVADRQTAQSLKAWYRQFCKRPCFHDAYLQAFNNPTTHLIDTEGKGVERITEKGVVVAGVEYELDCLIYASGFEFGTAYTERAGFDPVGRGGVRLSERWASGMRTKHGIHVHDFPNLFMVQLSHGANLGSNVPHNLTEAGKTIAITIRHALDVGAHTVEVTQDAEDAWMQLLHAGGARLTRNPDCTPGYYNNEGQPETGPGPTSDLFIGYPSGPAAYFRYIKAWRGDGKFEGLVFS
jgi:cation diffusion facilitator CzcD-associated flavoprotein CzcO